MIAIQSKLHYKQIPDITNLTVGRAAEVCGVAVKSLHIIIILTLCRPLDGDLTLFFGMLNTILDAAASFE